MVGHAMDCQEFCSRSVTRSLLPRRRVPSVGWQTARWGHRALPSRLMSSVHSVSNLPIPEFSGVIRGCSWLIHGYSWNELLPALLISTLQNFLDWSSCNQSDPGYFVSKGSL
jgi:hypothetical protein